jgi:hypothetical protein
MSRFSMSLSWAAPDGPAGRATRLPLCARSGARPAGAVARPQKKRLTRKKVRGGRTATGSPARRVTGYLSKEIAKLMPIRRRPRSCHVVRFPCGNIPEGVTGGGWPPPWSRAARRAAYSAARRRYHPKRLRQSMGRSRMAKAARTMPITTPARTQKIQSARRRFFAASLAMS